MRTVTPIMNSKDDRCRRVKKHRHAKPRIFLSTKGKRPQRFRIRRIRRYVPVSPGGAGRVKIERRIRV